MTSIEKILIRSEDCIRAFFEGFPIPTYVWQKIDDDFILVDYNNLAKTKRKEHFNIKLGNKASEIFRDYSGIIEDLERCYKKKHCRTRNVKFYSSSKLKKSPKHFLLKYGFVPPNLILIHIEDEIERKQTENDLYYQIIEGARDVIGIINKKFVIEFLNKEPFLKLTGFIPEEIIGTSALDYIHPDDVNHAIQALQDGETRGEGITSLRFRNKRGVYFWCEASGKTIIDNKGDLKGIIVIRDISEKKQMQQKLKESEANYRLITENINDLVGILDKKFKYEYLNEEIFLEVLGYSREELIGKSALKFIHPDDIKIAANSLRDGFERGEGSAEVRFKHKEGHWIWIEAKGKTFIDIDGNLKALIISRDINERRKSEQELRESEERYRLITENVNDLIAILNDKFEYEYINEKIHQKLRGSSNRDRIGTKAIDLVHPDDIGSVKEIFSKAFEIGEGILEVRLRNKDGTYDWFEVKGKTFIDVDNKKKILLISRNITARLEAAEKIQESEEKFRSIAEQSSLGIIILQDGLIKYVNNAITEITGYSIEEIRIWTQNEFMNKIHPEDLSLVLEHLQMKLKGETDLTSHYSFRIITKSNNVKWVDLHSKAIKLKGRIAIFATFIDISDKVRAEQQLKESEQNYRDLYEEAPNAYFSINRERSIIKSNSAAEKLLEYSKNELLNMKIDNLYSDSEEGIQKANHLFQKFLDGNAIQDEELQMRKKNGDPVWISLTVKPIFDSNGKVIESRSMVIDITERKIAENALKVSEQKYRDAFNRANFYKDLFAHDINNILQIINSSAELISLNLRDNEESKEIGSIANIVKRQVQRGSKLVNNVQTLSELEEAEIPTNPVDVCEQLDNSIEFVKKSYAERTLNIKIDQFCEEIIVNANDYLEKVFENVLINAVKYNENPSVDIKIILSSKLHEGRNYYKLEFIDNGIGVSDERKKLIFERGKRELKGAKGMGLGLSLVKKIVDSFNGKIWVEDRVKRNYPQGSKFVILLPVLEQN